MDADAEGRPYPRVCADRDIDGGVAAGDLGALAVMGMDADAVPALRRDDGGARHFDGDLALAQMLRGDAVGERSPGRHGSVRHLDRDSPARLGGARELRLGVDGVSEGRLRLKGAALNADVDVARRARAKAVDGEGLLAADREGGGLYVDIDAAGAPLKSVDGRVAGSLRLDGAALNVDADVARPGFPIGHHAPGASGARLDGDVLQGDVGGAARAQAHAGDAVGLRARRRDCAARQVDVDGARAVMPQIHPVVRSGRQRDGEVHRVDADVVRAADALDAADSLVRAGRAAAHGGLRRRLPRAEEEREEQARSERGRPRLSSHGALLFMSVSR